VVEVAHQILGNVTLPGPPLRFFTASDLAETTLKTHTAPPMLDQDGDAIREWLGLAAAGTSGGEAGGALGNGGQGQ
jgi:hypothetical protein